MSAADYVREIILEHYEHEPEEIGNATQVAEAIAEHLRPSGFIVRLLFDDGTEEEPGRWFDTDEEVRRIPGPKRVTPVFELTSSGWLELPAVTP